MHTYTHSKNFFKSSPKHPPKFKSTFSLSAYFSQCVPQYVIVVTPKLHFYLILQGTGTWKHILTFPTPCTHSSKGRGPFSECSNKIVSMKERMRMLKIKTRGVHVNKNYADASIKTGGVSMSNIFGPILISFFRWGFNSTLLRKGWCGLDVRRAHS